MTHLDPQGGLPLAWQPRRAQSADPGCCLCQLQPPACSALTLQQDPGPPARHSLPPGAVRLELTQLPGSQQPLRPQPLQVLQASMSTPCIRHWQIVAAPHGQRPCGHQLCFFHTGSETTGHAALVHAPDVEAQRGPICTCQAQRGPICTCQAERVPPCTCQALRVPPAPAKPAAPAATAPAASTSAVLGPAA